MSVVFDHPWLGGLFADPDAQAIWSAERQLAHMIAFEAAWTRANAAVGLLEPEGAARAAAAVERWAADAQSLRVGTAVDGLPVPALVRALKRAAGEDAAAIHVGSTSQDVMDTALASTLRESSALLERRLTALLAALEALTARVGDAALMGRTRMQAARPIAARVRLRAWSAPWPRHRERLAALRPRVDVLQLGGATGDGAPFAAHADALAAHMSDALHLAPAAPWHTVRDGIADYASLLSMIAGGCGRIGQDIALMAQQGVDEIALAGGGASSAMAHKKNPIRAELLVTLARYAATQLPALHHALVHEQERSGTAWALEWMTLPPLAISACRALDVTTGLLADVVRVGPGGDGVDTHRTTAER